MGSACSGPVLWRANTSTREIWRSRSVTSTGGCSISGVAGGCPVSSSSIAGPARRGVLLDVQRRRCEFLTAAVATLDLGDRISVECGRAEVLAREEHLRGAFDLVVARSFGPPAVTAECAVGFLRAGGELVVTEPPDADRRPERWDAAGLAEIGFGDAAPIRVGETGAVRIPASRVPDARWPRRDGVPAKRPLW